MNVSWLNGWLSSYKKKIGIYEEKRCFTFDCNVVFFLFKNDIGINLNFFLKKKVFFVPLFYLHKTKDRGHRIKNSVKRK